MGRLDGFYVVNPAPDTTDLSGQSIDRFLEGDFFAMRWSEWNYSTNPPPLEFRIEIDSQPYNAALTEAADELVQILASNVRCIQRCRW